MLILDVLCVVHDQSAFVAFYHVHWCDGLMGSIMADLKISELLSKEKSLSYNIDPKKLDFLPD